MKNHNYHPFLATWHWKGNSLNHYLQHLLDSGNIPIFSDRENRNESTKLNLLYLRISCVWGNETACVARSGYIEFKFQIMQDNIH